MGFGRWNNYVPTTRQPAIRAYVEVTGADVDQLNGASKQLKIQAEALLKRQAAILHQRIVDTWPIAKKKPKYSILKWHVATKGLEIEIDNPAPYVIYVHRPGARGTPPMKSGWATIWNTEINKPGTGMIAKWFKDLTTEMRKVLIKALTPKSTSTPVRGGRFRLR